MDVAAIRERLGLNPQEGVAWFSVDEKHVAFAPSKSPGLRPVILRSWPTSGPLAVVFARTSTGSSGLQHAPHNHTSDNPRCWLDRPARIVTALRLSTRKSVLDHSTAMCDEPDAAVTRCVLAVEVVR